MPTDNFNIDRELLRLIAEGDERAFRQLFHRYKQKIYTVALRITRSETSAEELLQDIFLIIWLKREHLNQIEDFNSYLFIIARNEAYKALKKAARERKSAQGSNPAILYHTETEETISIRDYTALLQRAIANLPPQQKQVYKLIKEDGLTREQTAQMMQINSETVKSHLAKAIKAIRAFCIANFEVILIVLTLIYSI